MRTDVLVPYFITVAVKTARVAEQPTMVSHAVKRPIEDARKELYPWVADADAHGRTDWCTEEGADCSNSWTWRSEIC